MTHDNVLCLKAMQMILEPKLVASDLIYFNQLISDLFPG